MWIRLELLLHSGLSLLAMIAGRLRRGPGRPSWGWLDELVAVAMKRHFARVASRPWNEQRQIWAALALPALLDRLSVHFESLALGGIPALRVRPRSPPRADAPVVFFLHGGAYVFGNALEYRDLLSRLARASGCELIAIDYRLAPEHPFPAALDDAVVAYRALLASGVDPEHLVVAGDSAGGGLAVALLVAARNQGLPLPVRAALVGPWVDLAAEGGSMETNEVCDVFTRPLIAHWAKVVVAGADPADPRISPARADLRGLPPLLVQVGGAEMLLTQDTTFAERARAAGVSVQLRVWDDCFHDWLMYAAVLSSGRRAIRELAAFLGTGVLVAEE